VVQHSLWLADPGRVTTTIPVCFELSSSPTIEGGAIPAEWTRVRDAVEATWERETNLRFEGWDYCRAGARGLRIHMSPANPNEVAGLFGSDLDGVVFGVRLSTDSECVSARPECAGLGWLDPDNDCFLEEGEEGTTAADIDACTRNSAVHEIGHGLALQHEQYHPDAPEECAASMSLPSSPVHAFDESSVMSYCGRQPRNQAGVWGLSDGDVAGIRALYGGPDQVVRSGATVLFRATTGDFLSRTSGVLAADGDTIGRDTLFRVSGITRPFNSPLQFGDEVRVVHDSTGRFVEATASGIRLVSTATAACTFRISDARTFLLGRPPSEVLVNAPVTLAHTSEDGVVRHFSIAGRGNPTWRILGDFAPTGAPLP
jgi:hypothetical protein